jgi:hypothetical protein
MKANISKFVNGLYLALLGLFINVSAFAQENGLKVDITKSETTTATNWYANPWAWVVGAAIFILLFAAILRSGRSDA